MKVCYVTMAFPTPTETFACAEVRRLDQWGVTVSVHALRPAFPGAARMLCERGIAHIPLTHGSVGNNLRGLALAVLRPLLLIDLLAFIFRTNGLRLKHLVLSLIWVPRVLDLFTRIEKDRPDVVNLFWGHFPSLIGYLVQQRLPETVLSMSLRAYDLDMEFPCTAPVARRADVVRTIARANVPAIRKLGVEPERILLCYSGVELSQLAPQTGKVRHRLLVAARLIREKKIEDVLEVFARLRQKWPEATLHVLGDGPERARLEAVAAAKGLGESVRFRGHVTHEQVFAEMAEAEVFLFLSQLSGERVPNAVKEAMGSRCLCVVTDTRGMDELIADGQTGFIVPQGDREAAFRVIDGAFHDPERLAAMAEAARETIEARFDFEECIQPLKVAWDAAREKRRPAVTALS